MLQILLDFLNHGLIFGIAQGGSAGVHGKGGAPLKFILVLGDQMEMQVAAAVTVSAIIYLVGVECLVDCVRGLGPVLNKGRPLLGGDGSAL